MGSPYMPRHIQGTLINQKDNLFASVSLDLKEFVCARVCRKDGCLTIAPDTSLQTKSRPRERRETSLSSISLSFSSERRGFAGESQFLSAKLSI